MKVAIRYTFIFDPAETWEAQSGFENDLAQVFAVRGLQAELVETQGKEDVKYLLINKVPMPAPLKTKTVQQNINSLEQKRDDKGRYLNV